MLVAALHWDGQLACCRWGTGLEAHTARPTLEVERISDEISHCQERLGRKYMACVRKQRYTDKRSHKNLVMLIFSADWYIYQLIPAIPNPTTLMSTASVEAPPLSPHPPEDVGPSLRN